MTSGRRPAVALVGLALLLFTGWAIVQDPPLSGDLRKFMPAQDATAQAAKSQAARAADESKSTAERA